MDDFVAETRRVPNGSQFLESSRAVPRFLFELAGRTSFRRFPGIELAGRDLHQVATCRESVLADQQDSFRVKEGDDRRRPGVAKQIKFDPLAIREIHGLSD